MFGKFVTRISLAAMCLSLFLLTFNASSAASLNNSEDWHDTTCRNAIGVFTLGSYSLVQRLRPKDDSKQTLGVEVELGSPNHVGVDVMPGWSFQLPAQNITEASEYAFRIADGGWLAIKFVGGKTEDILSSSVFFVNQGRCERINDGGRFTSLKSLPEGLRSFFQAKADESAAALKAQSLATETTSADAAKSTASMPAGDSGNAMASVGCHRPDVMHDSYAVDLHKMTGPDGTPYFLAGKTEFEQPLNELSVEQRRQWAKAVNGGLAWALYGRDATNSNQPFSVQFIYFSNNACTYYPDTPVSVETMSLPADVTAHYLVELNVDASGGAFQMHSRLAKTLRGETPVPQSAIASNAKSESQTETHNSNAGDLASRGAGAQGVQPSAKPADVTPDEQTNSNVLVDTYPIPLRMKFAELQTSCQAMGGKSVRLDKEFVKTADLDGDGKLDYIADGDKAHCDFENGRSQIIGGGSTGANVWIVMMTPKGAVGVEDIFIPQGKIRAHKGFATIQILGEGAKSLKIKGGKLTALRKIPSGGKVVFTVGELDRG
jgi:hypothetical protein